MAKRPKRRGDDNPGGYIGEGLDAAKSGRIVRAMLLERRAEAWAKRAVLRGGDHNRHPVSVRKYAWLAGYRAAQKGGG
jgi:hypothetical protein